MFILLKFRFFKFCVIKYLSMIRIGVKVILGIRFMNGIKNNVIKKIILYIIEVSFVFLLFVILVVFFIVVIEGLFLRSVYVIVENEIFKSVLEVF